MLAIAINALLWLVGLFTGKSAQERLGQEEVKNTDLKADNALLKAQEQAIEHKEPLEDALRDHKL